MECEDVCACRQKHVPGPTHTQCVNKKKNEITLLEKMEGEQMAKMSYCEKCECLLNQICLRVWR